MNPHRANIDNLRRQIQKLKAEEQEFREKFISGRNLDSLRVQLQVIDNYLQKARKYNYWPYFKNDWEKICTRQELPMTLDSLLYLELLGTSPLNSLLNKTKKNLEKVNPWNIQQLQVEIKKTQGKLESIKKRKYFKSQSKFDQLGKELTQQVRCKKNILFEECEGRTHLDQSRAILREYIKKWNKVSKKHDQIVKIQRVIEKESPYEKVHELAYAKAALVDDKTRALAVQKKNDIEKTRLCPYCDDLLGDDPHLDHIHPVNRGGLSTKDNLVWCCAECNLKKSNKGLIEFLTSNGLDIENVCNRLLSQCKKV